jgi:hypothetical protein
LKLDLKLDTRWLKEKLTTFIGLSDVGACEVGLGAVVLVGCFFFFGSTGIWGILLS